MPVPLTLRLSPIFRGTLLSLSTLLTSRLSVPLAQARLSLIGMPPDNYQSNRSYAFMPFDCSAVYWNNATPLPQPQSDIIDKAAALLETTTKQLHPETNTDPKLNPQLASGRIQSCG